MTDKMAEDEDPNFQPRPPDEASTSLNGDRNPSQSEAEDSPDATEPVQVQLNQAEGSSGNATDLDPPDTNFSGAKSDPTKLETVETKVGENINRINGESKASGFESGETSESSSPIVEEATVEIEEKLKLTIAQIQASCAKIANVSSQHSVQVKTFYALSELCACIEEIEPKQLRLVQPGIEKALLEIISGPFSACLTSRFHHVLERCFVLIYTRGDSRNILEVVNVLQARIASKAAHPPGRTAAVKCLSSICASQGRLLLGHLPETIAILSKLLKSSSTLAMPLLRSVAVECSSIAAASCGIGGKHVHADVFKLLSRALNDKSVMVRQQVGSALFEFSKATNNFETIGLDQFVDICKKGMEDDAISVRLSFAKSLGQILSSNCVENDKLDNESESTLDDPKPDDNSSEDVQENQEDAQAEKRSSRSESPSATTLANPTISMSNIRGFAMNTKFNLPTSFGRKRAAPVTSYTTKSALEMLTSAFADSNSRQGRIAIAHAVVTLLRANMENDKTQQRLSHSMKICVSTCRRVACFAPLVHPSASPTATSFSIGQLGVNVKPASGGLREHFIFSGNDPKWFNRACASYILRDVFGERVSQRYQLLLLEKLLELLNHIGGKGIKLRRNSSFGSSSTLSNTRRKKKKGGKEWKLDEQEILFALVEITRLICSTGTAATAFEDDIVQVIPTLLEHPLRNIRLEAAVGIHAATVALQTLASRLLFPMLQAMGVLLAEVAVSEASDIIGPGSSLSGEKPSSGGSLVVLEGYINALCAIIHASAKKVKSSRGINWSECGLNSHSVVAVLGYAKALIARQHDRAMKPHASARCTAGGWTLITSLVTLGPHWCKDHLSQMLHAWTDAFQQPNERQKSYNNSSKTKGGSSKLDPSDTSNLTTLACVTSACVALVTFVRCNIEMLREIEELGYTIGQFLTKITEMTLLRPCTRYDKSTGSIIMVRLHTSMIELATLIPLRYMNNTDTYMRLLNMAQAYICGSVVNTVQRSEKKQEIVVGTTSLLKPGKLLNSSDNVLDGAFSHQSIPVSDDSLGSTKWLLEIEGAPSKHLAMLCNAMPLSEAEALASTTNNMVWQTCFCTNLECENRSLNIDDETSKVGVTSGNLFAVGVDEVNAFVPEASLFSRVVDVSVVLFGATFGSMTAAHQDVQYNLFVNALRNASEKNKPSIARNVLASVLVANIYLAAKKQAQFGASASDLANEKYVWLGKARGVVCAALSSPQSVVRRAAAESLGLLVYIAGDSFAVDVCNTLTAFVKSAGSHFTRAGAILALVYIRKTLGVRGSKLVRNNTVYDMCKQTMEPMKTWSLHAWCLLIDNSPGVDVVKYVKPTIALVNAHILAANKLSSSDPSLLTVVNTGPILCLLRLINTLMAGLGPEIRRDDSDDIVRQFLTIWFSIQSLICSLGRFEPFLQRECLHMIEQIILFQPNICFINTATSWKKDIICDFLVRELLPDDDLHQLTQGRPRGDITQGKDYFFHFFTGKNMERYDVLNSCTHIDNLHLAVDSLVHLVEKYPDTIGSDRSMWPLFFALYEHVRKHRNGSIPASCSFSIGADHINEFKEKHGAISILENSLRRGIEILIKGPENSDDTLANARRRCNWALLCVEIATGNTTAEKANAASKPAGTVESENVENEVEDEDEETSREREFDNKALEVETEEEEYHCKNGKIYRSASAYATYSGSEEGLGYNFPDSLHDCGWETKVFAMECLVQILDVAHKEGLKEHFDMALAQGYLTKHSMSFSEKKKNRKKQHKLNTNKKLISVFLVQHLRKLVSGACQLASASIPFVQVAGLRALVKIVQLFGSGLDPYAKTSSKQQGVLLMGEYEAQLNATLRPCLTNNSSLMVEKEGCVLSTVLLSLGVSSSARRIATTILPKDYLETSDSEDEVGSEAENQDKSAIVKSSILICRLDTLARLWFIAIGRSPVLTKAKKKAPEKIRKDLKKVLLPYLNNLTTDWISIVRDYGLEKLKEKEGLTVKHPEALFETLTEGSALMGAYEDSWWVTARLLALITVSDSKSKTYANLDLEPEKVYELILNTCIMFVCDCSNLDKIGKNQVDERLVSVLGTLGILVKSSKLSFTDENSSCRGGAVDLVLALSKLISGPSKIFADEIKLESFQVLNSLITNPAFSAARYPDEEHWYLVMECCLNVVHAYTNKMALIVKSSCSLETKFVGDDTGTGNQATTSSLKAWTVSSQENLVISAVKTLREILEGLISDQVNGSSECIREYLPFIYVASVSILCVSSNNELSDETSSLVLKLSQLKNYSEESNDQVPRMREEMVSHLCTAFMSRLNELKHKAPSGNINQKNKALDADGCLMGMLVAMTSLYNGSSNHNSSFDECWITCSDREDIGTQFAAFKSLGKLLRSGSVRSQLPRVILVHVCPKVFLALQDDKLIQSIQHDSLVLECIDLVSSICLVHSNAVDIAVLALLRIATQKQNPNLHMAAREGLLLLATKCQGQFKSKVQSLPADAQEALRQVLLVKG